MVAYLKIENPGVACSESFTLLGASTKRNSGNIGTIGKFGSGGKMGVGVLLRHKLSPIVFAGNLKLEFGTRPQTMDTGISSHNFERVFVKFGGKDSNGVNRSATEDLGFVLDYGATDWLNVDLALREFVSNSIDRAVEEGEVKFIAQHEDPDLETYRKTAKDYQNVVVEVVNESQVRAKAGFTRVFIPMNTDVFAFYNNLGKWFLHFSEPELLNQEILPKSNRNLGESRTAVVYRRGVRVREFTSSDTPSLFDYNLQNLDLDESRKVDDWAVLYAAGKAISCADENTVARIFQSFLDEGRYWEHSFGNYGLESGLYSGKQRDVWKAAFERVAGANSVISTESGGANAIRKGYNVVSAPESFVQAAEMAGILTPAKVLSQDDREGREIFEATPDAFAAVEFVWSIVEKYGVTNGKIRPQVKTFRKIMDGCGQTLGFYRDDTVYINQDIAASGSEHVGLHALTQQLLVTVAEEVIHHVTGASDFSKDVQNFTMNLMISMAKEIAGV